MGGVCVTMDNVNYATTGADYSADATTAVVVPPEVLEPNSQAVPISPMVSTSTNQASKRGRVRGHRRPRGRGRGRGRGRILSNYAGMKMPHTRLVDWKGVQVKIEGGEVDGVPLEDVKGFNGGMKFGKDVEGEWNYTTRGYFTLKGVGVIVCCRVQSEG